MPTESESLQSSWWPMQENSVTRAYIDAHYEFDFVDIHTGRPYTGIAWSLEFCSIPHSDAWRLRHDHIGNGLTADLIAAAELLTLPYHDEYSGGFPGGATGEGMSTWLPFLDGGVFVDFSQYEHEYTNTVHASQITVVRGALALRYLLNFLGFEPPKRRLKGEKCVSELQHILLLLERHRNPDSAEAKTLMKQAYDAYWETRKLVLPGK